MSRSHAAARLLLLSCVLVVGCGKDSTGMDQQDETGHPPAEMVGTWIFQSVTEDGSPASLADVQEWESGAVQATVTLLENGSYLYEELDGVGAQLFEEHGWVFVDQEGGTIVIHVQGDSNGPVTETANVSYTLVGGVFKLTELDGVTVYVYTLTM